MNMALTNPQPSVSMQDWEVMRSQAAMLVTTGFLPSSIKTPEQAVAIILLGRELGIPTMAALGTINVIQGKPAVSPQLMLALIYRSKLHEIIDVEEETETRCVVLMKRKGQPEHRETFTIEDARKITTTEWVDGKKTQSVLADKYNWRSMPKTMLKWRAIAACARVVFPDVVLGLYTPEEMGANVEVSDEGEMQVLPDPTPAKVTEVKAPRMIDRFKEPEEPPAHIEPATGQIIEAEPGSSHANFAPSVMVPLQDEDRAPTPEERADYNRGLDRARAIGMDTSYYAVEPDTGWLEMRGMRRRLMAAIKAQEAAQTTLPSLGEDCGR